MNFYAQSALIVVDVQVDFCPGGALAVPEGDAVVPVLNRYIRLFRAAGRPVVFTRDWHPPQTIHFVTQGGPWPPHCIQNTPGAAFHPQLELPQEMILVSKGMRPDEDAYSGFEARDAQGRLLPAILRELGIQHVYIGGLTLDYCVRTTSLDAVREGFGVTVLLDATRAVNVKPHDGELAIIELLNCGAGLATIETLTKLT